MSTFTGMQVAWLPVNQCWIVGIGLPEGPVLDVDGRRHWSDREELVSELEAKGLRVDPKTGEVSL